MGPKTAFLHCSLNPTDLICIIYFFEKPRHKILVHVGPASCMFCEVTISYTKLWAAGLTLSKATNVGFNHFSTHGKTYKTSKLRIQSTHKYAFHVMCMTCNKFHFDELQVNAE